LKKIAGAIDDKKEFVKNKPLEKHETIGEFYGISI
jgi:hypothetical protein